MTKYTITKVGKRCHFRLDRDGRLVEQFEFSPTSRKSQTEVAEIAGVTREEILSVLDELNQAQQVSREYDDTPQNDGVWIRSAYRSERIHFQTVKQALDARELEICDPVIEWLDGTICCLDVDYHDTTPPDDDRIRWLVAILHPVPFLWHRSHGGGVKLYYQSKDLAAVAALAWLNSDPVAGVELKNNSRHPHYPSSRHGGAIVQEHFERTPTQDMGQLVKFLRSDVSPEDVSEYLDERGWVIGQRLAHRHCCIDPTDDPSESIQIYESGIHCFRCAGKGISHLGRAPGFTPWSALIGGVSTLVAKCAKNFVHWQHAEALLEHELRLAPALLRVCYEALLRLIHGPDDPRVEAVFTVPVSFVRFPGRWTTRDGATSLPKDVTEIIGRLPRTWTPEGKPDPALVKYFCVSQELSDYGYVPLHPIRGCKIYGQHNSYSDTLRVPLVLPSSDTKKYGDTFSPKYVAGRDEEAAWQHIEQYLPGINRSYVKLLICAKGCTEAGGAGLHPMIMVTGPSQTGKSNTVFAASSICGGTVSNVTWNPQTERFRQAIHEASERSCYVVCDEIIKDAGRSRVDPIQALDPILNLTEGSLNHVLYRGPVPLSNLPVIVTTDVTCPQEVRNDVQISRRLIHVQMDRALTWHNDNCGGLGHARRLRYHNRELADSCNVILSSVIDEFFVDSTMTFAQMAEQLGFSMLLDSPDFEDPTEDLKLLFDVLSKHPTPQGRDLDRWSGKGWKVIHKGDIHPLAEVWERLRDKGNWKSSRRCEERDWSALLGVSEKVLFDVSGNGESTIAIRFRVGSRNNPTKVNEEILQ